MKQKIRLLLILFLVVCSSFFAMHSSKAYAAEDSSLKIIPGGFHTNALFQDGTLWTWGDNRNGQLGDGENVCRSAPLKLSTLGTVKYASSGLYHTIAEKTDGTVWAWGYNGKGELGVGDTKSRTTPTKVTGITNVKQIICTNNCISLALKEDGTVWAWGYNGDGLLGDGTTADKSTPTQVKGLSSIKAIACSYNFCLALKTDGTVWAWGKNASGQLGDGTKINRTIPVQVLL